MSTSIKENGLPQEASTDPEVLKDMFVRFVTALGTGSSKNKKLSELILKIANIYGLQTALDSKIGKNVPGGTGIIPSYLADGDIDFSTFKIGTFDNAATIGSLMDNGFYTAGGTGSSYYNFVMGYVVAVITINNTQIILSSDRGIWYRVYSGSWSYPLSVGGTPNNIMLTYAQALEMASTGQLTTGTLYSIYDHAEYESLVLTAATSSTFNPRGLVYAPRPLYRDVATHTIGGEDVSFVGCWSFLDSVTTGDVAWYCNRLYANMTGAVGTATNFVLDSTNWSKIDFRVNPEFYAFEWHEVIYDYANDYVKLESDALGNEFGDIIKRTPDDGFRCHMNDWSIEEFKNNKCNRWYNNNYGSCENNSGGADVYGNNTGGINGCRFNGSVCIIANNYNTQISNCVLNYEAIITGNGNTTASVTISGCDIGGEIQDNAKVPSIGASEVFNLVDCRIGKSGDIKRCYGSIIESVIDGNIFDNNTDDSGSMDIQYSNIHAGCTINDCTSIGLYDTIVRSQVVLYAPSLTAFDSIISATINTSGDVLLTRVELNGTLTGSNDHTYTDSIVYNQATSTPTETQNVRESVSKITGSCYIGTGQFSVANGASYSPASIISGCVVTTIRENGVSIASETTGPEITAHRTGWFRFFYNASVLCQVNALDLESIVCVNGTPVQAGYNRKTYPNYDSFINSGLFVDLDLTAGDVVTMQYKHGNGTPVTFTLGQINMELTYAN